MTADLLILSDSIFTAAADECQSGLLVIEDGLIKELLPLEKAAEAFDLKISSSDIAAVAEAFKHSALASKFKDARGKLVTPGLIDAHTHLVHGGNRSNELLWKLEGKDYMQIRELGGGIASTVKATREASKEELKAEARKDLRSMLLHGTVTVEAKSGYGLDKETELRQLEVVKELNEELDIRLVSTYMGAHDIPPEDKGNEQAKAAYIDFIINEMIPLVKERNLAEFFDIFCEKGIFSAEESEKLAEAAIEAGFGLKVHSDEIYSIGGTKMAVDHKAVSCEHLMVITDEDIEHMAKSDTVAVLLPATSYFLMVEDFAPGKKMIEKGVTVAIASDYNPGSSPCENLQTAMSRACFNMRLLPSDILKGVTINAAKALRREKETGSLEKGKYADICIWNVATMHELLYRFGANRIDEVYIGGELKVSENNIIS